MIKAASIYKKNLETHESFLNLNSYFSNDLGGENFVSFEADFSKTSKNGIDIYGFTDEIPFPYLTLTQKDPDLGFLRLSLETKKVINRSLYFKIFPLSIRRSAFSLLYHNFLGTYSKETGPHIFGLNHKTESLLLHSNIISFNLSLFRNLKRNLTPLAFRSPFK